MSTAPWFVFRAEDSGEVIHTMESPEWPVPEIGTLVQLDGEFHRVKMVSHNYDAEKPCVSMKVASARFVR